MGAFGPLVRPILVTRACTPVHRRVIESGAVFMHDVFPVALMDSPLAFKCRSGFVSILSLLDFKRRLLILRLGLPVGGDFCRTLPTLEVRQKRTNRMYRSTRLDQVDLRGTSWLRLDRRGLSQSGNGNQCHGRGDTHHLDHIVSLRPQEMGFPRYNIVIVLKTMMYYSIKGRRSQEES